MTIIFVVFLLVLVAHWIVIVKVRSISVVLIVVLLLVGFRVRFYHGLIGFIIGGFVLFALI